jgi:hypothetical protein
VIPYLLEQLFASASATIAEADICVFRGNPASISSSQAVVSSRY